MQHAPEVTATARRVVLVACLPRRCGWCCQFTSGAARV